MTPGHTVACESWETAVRSLLPDKCGVRVPPPPPAAPWPLAGCSGLEWVPEAQPLAPPVSLHSLAHPRLSGHLFPGSCSFPLPSAYSSCLPLRGLVVTFVADSACACLQLASRGSSAVDGASTEPGTPGGRGPSALAGQPSAHLGLRSAGFRLFLERQALVEFCVPLSTSRHVLVCLCPCSP